MTEKPTKAAEPIAEEPSPRRRRFYLLVGAGLAGAFAAALVALLLVNISERKHEGQNPYFRVVELTEETVDPRRRVPWVFRAKRGTQRHGMHEDLYPRNCFT